MLYVVVAIAVVGAAAVLLARGGPVLADDPGPRRPLAWPADGDPEPADLARVRFTVALRGYRAEEVDRVLDDLRDTLADRDRQVAGLREALAAAEPVEAAGPGPGDPAGPEPVDPAGAGMPHTSAGAHAAAAPAADWPAGVAGADPTPGATPPAAEGSSA